MNPESVTGMLLALAAGGALGLGYFVGLWWTVRRMAASPRPWLLALASLAIRGGLALAGFHLVMNGDWRRAAACLAGFILARMALVRWLRPGGRLGGEAS